VASLNKDESRDSRQQNNTKFEVLTVLLRIQLLRAATLCRLVRGSRCFEERNASFFWVEQSKTTLDPPSLQRALEYLSEFVRISYIAWHKQYMDERHWRGTAMFSEQRLIQWHCLHLKVHLDCGDRATTDRLSHFRLIRAVVSVIRQQDSQVAWVCVRRHSRELIGWIPGFACSCCTLNRRKHNESSPSPPGHKPTVL